MDDAVRAATRIASGPPQVLPGPRGCAAWHTLSPNRPTSSAISADTLPLLTPDERTRDDHADADGQVVAMGNPFDVELAASGVTVTVGAAQSILEAMEAAGVDAPYLCRGGACGQCETAVIRCDGHIHHHDHWLTPEDKASNRKIMPCVSRFEGKSLVLDR